MSGDSNHNGNAEAMPQPTALIITASEEIETTAAAVATQLKLMVEIASSRATALRLLGRRSYSIVVLDQNLAESDAAGADLIWKNAGLAIPLQINFALAGSARLEREVRAALARREREQELAVAAATAAVDDEIKNAITGFLLETGLALAEENLPLRIEERLQKLAEIASRLRERLLPTVPGGTTSVSLLDPQECPTLVTNASDQPGYERGTKATGARPRSPAPPRSTEARTVKAGTVRFAGR
jgi:hypothetical protein